MTEREVSVGNLVSSIVGDVQNLARQEIALALAIADLFNWPAWAGFGIVGLVFAIVGGVLLYNGQKEAKEIKPVPEKTIETMKENVEWIKDRTTSDRT